MSISEELKQLYEADQKDVTATSWDDIDWEKVREANRKRLARVIEIYEQSLIKTPDDMFYAGMIFQHGEKSEHYKKAIELSKKAYELGHEQGKWLYPRAEDRYLLSLGKPQVWGTQFRIFPKNAKGKRAHLNGEFDRSARSDEERKKFDIDPEKALREIEGTL